MNVRDIPYERIPIEEIRRDLEQIIAAKAADNVERILALREQMLRLLARYQSSAALCEIRHTRNTADPFYRAEHVYYDEIAPSWITSSTVW